MKTKLILTSVALMLCVSKPLFCMEDVVAKMREALQASELSKTRRDQHVETAQFICKARAEDAIKKHREHQIFFGRSAVAHEESCDGDDVLEKEQTPSTFSAIASWLMCTIGVASVVWVGADKVVHWVESRNIK